MIKIDLITGFLGSGKTTFLKQYAKYLMAQGKNIGILENDFGVESMWICCFCRNCAAISASWR